MVRGVFPIVSSIGLPLPDILKKLRQNDMVVDWIDFYDQAIDEGWKSERTLVRIKDSVDDVFGPVTGKRVLKRLKLYLKI